jgi:hypothetical protein
MILRGIIVIGVYFLRASLRPLLYGISLLKAV